MPRPSDRLANFPIPSSHCVAGLLLAAAAAASAVAQAPPPADADSSAERLRELQSQLDRQYLVPASAVNDLGFRIEWQTVVPLSPASRLSDLFPRGNAVFAVDDRNLLSRLQSDRGSLVWQSPVGEAIAPIRFLFRVVGEGRDQLFAVSDFAIHVVDAANGVGESRQGLERSLGTPPAVYDPYIIFGTRAGQVVWHQFEVGYQWRANSMPGSVSAAPLLVGDQIFAVGSTGAILALDAASSRRVWDKQLVSGVAAQPAAAEGLLLVPGLDHYLWAFEAATGRTVWSYFTQSPLATSPLVVGDAVLQFVPTEGLVCLDLMPTDRIDGVVRWRSPEARGTPIGRHRGRLLLWDEPSRTLRSVELSSGRLVSTIPLPKVDRVVSSGGDRPDLLFANRDGSVMRIAPQP